MQAEQWHILAKGGRFWQHIFVPWGLLVEPDMNMQISDLKKLIELLSDADNADGKDLTHPVDGIVFSDKVDMFLNQSELEKYHQLEEQLQIIKKDLVSGIAAGTGNIEDLLRNYEDFTDSLNSLSQVAIFREGMINGFRLAQFLLLGIYKKS